MCIFNGAVFRSLPKSRRYHLDIQHDGPCFTHTHVKTTSVHSDLRRDVYAFYRLLKIFIFRSLTTFFHKHFGSFGRNYLNQFEPNQKGVTCSVLFSISNET